jgi:predicted RNA-binding protein with RPS1 domain
VSAQLPRLIRGTVTRHEPYGFYVDIGSESDGLVVITMVVDDPSDPNPPFPSVGTVIDAVLLGYTEIGGEARLSTRPRDLEDLRS